ncbi:MAG: hypothetical protein CM1200mP9_11110 [Gammaproteobacteria bacterium]|nr:MAG: hypothetical protein CM1200mP9_11110 [Gammaproteobacteria bacterium]
MSDFDLYLHGHDSVGEGFNHVLDAILLIRARLFRHAAMYLVQRAHRDGQNFRSLSDRNRVNYSLNCALKTCLP